MITGRAHVILACRDRKRTEEALKEIHKLSGSNNVEIEIVDLASLKSIQKCAKRLRGRLSKLDVLINNADLMKNAPSARIINVSSISHAFLNITINWDDISTSEFSSTKPPYQSKLKYEPEDITNEKYITEKINKLYEKYDGKLKELTEIETAKPKRSHRIENQLDDNSADGFTELVQELGVDPTDVSH
ncbi:unnamed protein product, partial [Adineta steineri]